MATYRIPIDISWTGASGSPGVNIWHGRDAVGQDDGAALDGLKDILEQFYLDSAGAYTGNTIVRFAGEATGVGDDTGSVFTADSWSVTGTGGTAAFPPSQCLLLQWRAATGGRNGRGRTFLGPLNDGLDEGNGTPDEGVRAGTLAAMNDLIEAVDTFGNGALGVYSRTEDTFRDFVSASVANYFAVLRSRRD